MLIAPITTIYYDTGFLIGLKGFVGAIIGGLVSYPLAAARRAARRPARVVLLVLGERVQGGHRLHADHPGAAVALAAHAPPRGGGRGMSRRALRCSSSSSRPSRSAPAVPARVLRHAAELHRPLQPGRARAGAAHRRGGLTLVRPGGLRRPRRLHHRGTSRTAYGAVAVADALRRARAHRRGRAVPRRDHAAPLGPLPAARHHRLGHQPLLPVRQPRVPRRPHRHRRRAARLSLFGCTLDTGRKYLLPDLGARARSRCCSHPATCSTRAPAARSARCAAAA